MALLATRCASARWTPALEPWRAFLFLLSGPDQMADKKRFFPQRSKIIENACVTSIQRLVINLGQIDEAIYIWNELLERAQPFINGRLVFKFLKENEWKVLGEREFEYAPVPGKMVKFVSGRWRFVKLDSVDRYENLSDLRVGKSYDSDPLVRKLIDGIEDLLVERKKIVDQLRAVRQMATGQYASLSKRTEDMVDMSLKLGQKIKIDWKANTDEAIEAQKEADRLRYLKRKQRLQTPRERNSRPADVS